MVDDDPVLKLLRRYEGECSRRIAKFKAMFKSPNKGAGDSRPSRAESEARRIRDQESYRRAAAALTAREVLPPAETKPIPECVAEPIVPGVEKADVRAIPLRPGRAGPAPAVAAAAKRVV